MTTPRPDLEADWTEKLCFWCGAVPAETRDHVVPKSWFSPPRPTLPTVPACCPCNQGYKDDEELLRVYLTATRGSNEAAQELYRGPVLRGLKRDEAERFRRRLLGSVRRMMAESPSGLLYPADFVIPEAPRVGRVLDKIVRGLYYAEFGERLDPLTVVRIQDSVGRDRVWRLLTGKRLGETLVYRFGRVQEQPTRSLWYLVFYGRSLFRILTGSEDLVDFVRRFQL